MAKTLKELAREAKGRLKSGFWSACREDLDRNLSSAREQGISETRVERFFADKLAAALGGEKEDEFYLRVKELLTTEGEVSDAIGRLTGNITKRSPTKKSSATTSPSPSGTCAPWRDFAAKTNSRRSKRLKNNRGRATIYL